MNAATKPTFLETVRAAASSRRLQLENEAAKRAQESDYSRQTKTSASFLRMSILEALDEAVR